MADNSIRAAGFVPGFVGDGLSWASSNGEQLEPRRKMAVRADRVIFARGIAPDWRVRCRPRKLKNTRCSQGTPRRLPPKFLYWHFTAWSVTVRIMRLPTSFSLPFGGLYAPGELNPRSSARRAGGAISTPCSINNLL